MLRTPALAIALMVSAACNATTTQEPTCAPGRQLACTCSDGGPGAHTCREDGSGFDVCVCEATPGTGGTGGTGSAGGGGSGGDPGPICTPGEVVDCYSDPSGTEGVGPCVGGTATCAPDGFGFGPCVGEVTPQQERCETEADENCDGQTPSCPETWARAIVATGEVDVTALTVDGAGAVVVAGDFAGSMVLGSTVLSATGRDLYLIKLDPAGEVVWARSFDGGDGDDAGRVVALVATTGDELLLAGELRGATSFGGPELASEGARDVFVARLDGSGEHLWSRRFGGPGDDFVESLAGNAAGSAVLALQHADEASYGGDALSPGLVLLSLDAAGEHRFSRGYASASARLVVGQSGIVMAGHFDGSLDLGGGVLTSTGRDVYLARLGPDGAHVHSVAYGGGQHQALSALAVDVYGNTLLAGTYGGTPGFGIGAVLLPASQGAHAFLAKVDRFGHHVFSRGWGSSGQLSRVAGLATTPIGDPVVAGSFTGAIDLGGGSLSSAGASDIVVGRFDPAGKHLFSDRYGDGASQVASHVARATGPGVILAGRYAGAVDFGGGLTLAEASGPQRGFVAYVEP